MKMLPENSRRSACCPLKFTTLFASLFFLAVGHSQQRPQRSGIGESNFIFYGEVIRPDSSNLMIEVTGNKAIVRILEIIDAVPAFENTKGTEVTVLLSTDGNTKGRQKVFYTVGWHYGKTLGLKEVQSDLSKNMQPGLKDQIASERIKMKNDSLMQQLNTSTLVVFGKVREAGIEDKEIKKTFSEHDPMLRKAIIDIKEIIKGKYQGASVTAYYAASYDVIWYDAPKLTQGQEGIFLLHLNQAPSPFNIKGYTLLHRLDFQPSDSVPLVRMLLKR